MWCCGSKPQTKKAIRSAKQQPLQKVILNLPPLVRLEYRKKWQGKIQQSIQKQQPETKQIQERPKSNPARLAAMKKKLEQYRKRKNELQETLNRQIQKGKQIQRRLQKIEAIGTVVQYMIVRQQEKIDGYVMGIKA